VLKIAAAVLAFFCIAISATPMSAQILPKGNVYGGVSYGDLNDVVVRQSYRGWNASAEDLPFSRIPYLGIAVDASGFYRTGVKQYNVFLGPRVSKDFDKWRPFLHALAGVEHVTSYGNVYNPVSYDIGGGADYKLVFKSFSWRVQMDYMRSRYASATQNNFRASTGIVWRF
jgi:hypothetical protein